MQQFLLTTVDLLFGALILVITARVLLSWVSPDYRSSQIGRMIMDISDPIMRPIQNLLPPAGMLDLSPIVAFVLLYVLRVLFDTIIFSVVPF